MPTVTRDGTSGWWTPANSSEWTSLLSGTGIGNPSSLWLLQEASGSLADSIGTATLSAGGAFAYQQTVSGWSRKAITQADNSTGFSNSTDASLPDLSTTSIMTLFFQAITSTPGGQRATTLVGSGSPFSRVEYNASNHYIIQDGTNTSTGATNHGTGVIREILRYNKTATTSDLFVDSEKISKTFLAGTGKQIAIGDVGFFTNPAIARLYGCAWFGAAAERSDADITTLLDRLQNGPAVTAIAVTPSPSTAMLPGTVQLTATATRADGSTFDATSTATWSSGTPGVATVSAAGLVTSVSAGTSIITASFTSLNATPASGTSTVTVGTAPTVPIPIPGTDVPDHVAAALSRLLEQDKNKPNITSLLTAYVTPTQDLESALWQLLTQRQIQTAIGTQLDALGKLVGIARNGLSDTDYRVFVYTQVAVNVSRGRREDLIAIAKLAVNNAAATITVAQVGTATISVTIGGIAETDSVGVALAGFLKAAAAAGVRVQLIYSTVIPSLTYRLDVGPGLDVGHLATGIG